MNRLLLLALAAALLLAGSKADAHPGQPGSGHNNGHAVNGYSAYNANGYVEADFQVIKDYFTARAATSSPAAIAPSLSDIRAEANNRCTGNVTEVWSGPWGPAGNPRTIHSIYDAGHAYSSYPYATSNPTFVWKRFAACDLPFDTTSLSPPVPAYQHIFRICAEYDGYDEDHTVSLSCTGHLNLTPPQTLAEGRAALIEGYRTLSSFHYPRNHILAGGFAWVWVEVYRTFLLVSANSRRSS